MCHIFCVHAINILFINVIQLYFCFKIASSNSVFAKSQILSLIHIIRNTIHFSLHYMLCTNTGLLFSFKEDSVYYINYQSASVGFDVGLLSTHYMELELFIIIINAPHLVAMEMI